MKKLLLTVLAVGLSFCFSLPAVADEGVMYGCVKAKKGMIRIVDGPEECNKKEESILMPCHCPDGAGSANGFCQCDEDGGGVEGCRVSWNSGIYEIAARVAGGTWQTVADGEVIPDGAEYYHVGEDSDLGYYHLDGVMQGPGAVVDHCNGVNEGMDNPKLAWVCSDGTVLEYQEGGDGYVGECD